MIRAALLALLCSCRALDATSLATATGTLACDWGQTRHNAALGWGARWEMNPVLGRHPDARTVDIYFGSVIVIHTLVFFLVPPRYRAVLPAGITIIQTDTVIDNYRNDDNLCGYQRR